MNNEGKSRRVSILAVLFFGILAVSTASIFIRFAQREASSVVIAVYRLTLASLILLPIALRGHRTELACLSRRQWLLIILSGVFLGVHFVSWITSLSLTSVATSVVLVTTTPLWVGLFSPLVLRERISKAVAVGLVVALVGGILVGLSESCALTAGGLACSTQGGEGGSSAALGSLLALAGAMTAAAYLFVGRTLRPSLSLIGYISTVYGVAAVTLVIMALLSGQPLFGFSPQTYLFFAALAVFPQLLGHSSFNYSLKYLSAAFVSVALLGEPIGSTILAMVVLKEIPTTLEVVGGIIILIGIFIATRTEK